MSAGHTPGPWAVDGVRINAINAINVNCSEGRSSENLVALAYSCGEASMEANARLIAAAPDLLAACEGALADAQEALMWAESSEIQGLLARCERLQAALAKATQP